MTTRKTHFRQRPAKSRGIRTIPRSSPGHFVGELVYTTRDGKQQRLGFASLTEFHTALCLIYRDDFADIEEQLAELPFQKPTGGGSRHFFDFRFTTKAGQRICISVKPERIAQTYVYRATIDAVAQAAVGNICDRVATVTERNIHPVELHNAKLFHAARTPEPELDAEIVSALQKLEAPVTIDHFLAETGHYGRGFFSVARAIRSGHARLFTPEKIRGKTLIERAA